MLQSCVVRRKKRDWAHIDDCAFKSLDRFFCFQSSRNTRPHHHPLIRTCFVLSWESQSFDQSFPAMHIEDERMSDDVGMNRSRTVWLFIQLYRQDRSIQQWMHCQFERNNSLLGMSIGWRWWWNQHLVKASSEILIGESFHSPLTSSLHYSMIKFNLFR